MSSSKLQYIPKDFAVELINTHFGNRLFEIDESLTRKLEVEDKEINNSAKVHLTFSKNLLIPIIVALACLALFFIGLTYLKSLFVVILLFVFFIVLDILLTIIFLCKQYFDKRFFK